MSPPGPTAPAPPGGPERAPPSPSPRPGGTGRRALLASAGAATAALAAAAVGLGLNAIPDRDTNADVALSNGPPRHVRLSAGGAASPPLAALVIAQTNGIFTAYNLDVAVIHHDHVDSAFADLAASRLDAVIGPAVKWLPALRAGTDARLVCGLHAGGMRLLVPRRSSITKIEDLDGKRVAVASLDSAVLQMFALMMRRKGMIPGRQIHWQQIDPAHFVEALDAGQVDAIGGTDPQMWRLRDQLHLTQIVSTDTGSFRERVSSVLGVRTGLLGSDLSMVTALVHALLDAATWTARHPKEAGEALAPLIAGMPADQIAAMLRSEGQDIHPIGASLRDQMAQYADELKLLGVFPETLNSGHFARDVTADIHPA